MRLLHQEGDALVFELAVRELQFLEILLEQFPRLEADYYEPTHGDVPGLSAEDRQLLRESIQQHQREVKRELLAALGKIPQPKDPKAMVQLTLERSQTELLLQMLNDTRVASWISLGKPDENETHQLPLNENTVPHLFAMDAAAHFQMVLLKAVGGME